MKQTWTPVEAAEILEVNTRTIRRLVEAGDLQMVEVKYGGKRIYGALMEKVMGDKSKRLNVMNVAEQLGVSRSTVNRWFWEGRLKGIKIGFLIKIYQSSVDDFLSAAEELSQSEVGWPDEKPFVRRNSTSKETEALPALARKARALRQTEDAPK